MPLTDAACRAAKCPADRPRARFTDAGGLYMEVAPSGSKRWFWKYYLAGKEKRLALGGYPETSLKDARRARDEARLSLHEGIDPAHQRRMAKLSRGASTGDTFEAVAREFHATKAPGWSETYAARWLERLAKDVFPWLGALPLRDIGAPLLLQTLRRVEARGVRELAHSLLQGCGQVLRYGIATGRADRNPAADLQGALRPINTKHVAAVLDPDQAGALMRAMRDYSGQPTTRAALLLSAYLFQRPGNIRAMEWAEVDLDAAVWLISSQKMKRTVHAKLNGRPHRVPLAPQAVALLQELQPLTGHGRYVFPSLITGERCMSENTVNVALRRLGLTGDEMTAHGFRAMARTLIVERLPGVSPDVVEAQLAHGKSGPLGMAYDRAEFMEQRRQLMTKWADYLDELEAGARP